MDSKTLLRQARNRSGLGQVDLAERTGIPQSTISRIETAVVIPRFDTLAKLVQGCGYELSIATPIPQIDRSLIRQQLKLSPIERIRRGAQAAISLSRLPRRNK